VTVLAQAQTLGDVLRDQAAARPGKTAFETLDGRRVDFAGFNRRVNRLCHALAACGVAPGARVALLSRNCIEYVEVYGAAKAGLVVVPLNWRLPAAELVPLLAHSAPKVLVVDEAHVALVDGLRAQLPTVRHWVVLGPARAGWLAYEDLLATASDTEPVCAVQPGDVLCIIYTSGTTGAPKGVALTHAGALGNVRTAATEMLGLGEADHTMAVMPLFHVGGFWYHLFPSFASGCTTLILADFDPATVLRELQARRISNVHLVPTMIAALLAHPDAAQADLRCLRLVFYAASSMPAELLRRAMQTFSQCGFAQAYGSTEAGVVSVLDPAAHQRARQPQGEHLLQSCGRAFSRHALRVVGANGQTLASGDIGEIEVRSADLMQGYWHNPAATQAVLHDGWLKTGDLGRIDDEGYLYIVDRKNVMVVTGGENVYPTEVEAQLYRDSAVLEAAVFGVPDPVWVERVVAAVVLRPGVPGTPETADEIQQRLRTRLAAYKCPKALYFVNTLPKSAVGKVLRKHLRQQYGTAV